MATEIFTLVLMSLYLAPFCTTMPSVMHVPNLTLPQSCIDKGYCFEKHVLYPQELVDKLTLQWVQNMTLDMQNKPQAAIGHREVGGAGASVAVLPTASRHSRYFDDENDCSREVLMDPIYEIVDKKNNTRVVVQSANSNIRQLIKVEECLNPGRVTKPSRHFSSEIVEYFNLHCKQRVLNYKFLVLNLGWTGFEMVNSKSGIPVACNCHFFGVA